MKTKTKIQKRGWVLQGDDGCFVNSDGDGVKQLKNAHLFITRKQAKLGTDDFVSLNTDVVRRVSLYKNGKAKKIIKRG